MQIGLNIISQTIIKEEMFIIFLQGYKHKRAFIVAEGPMQSTVRNFWKMVYNRNCAVVVMTSGLIERGQEASAQYWSDSGIAHYGEFAVDLLGAVAGLRGGLRGHRPTLLLGLCWSHANICTYMYARISTSILWSVFTLKA